MYRGVKLSLTVSSGRPSGTIRLDQRDETVSAEAALASRLAATESENIDGCTDFSNPGAESTVLTTESPIVV